MSHQDGFIGKVVAETDSRGMAMRIANCMQGCSQLANPQHLPLAWPSIERTAAGDEHVAAALQIIRDKSMAGGASAAEDAVRQHLGIEKGRHSAPHTEDQEEA